MRRRGFLAANCAAIFSASASLTSFSSVRRFNGGIGASESAFSAWRALWPGSVVGTLLTATTDHLHADYRAPALILMGNEQQGLTPDLAELCDVNVKIPMRGRADSLNLAVATGIMIYAAST